MLSGVSVCVCNPILGRQRQKGPWGSLASQCDIALSCGTWREPVQNETDSIPENGTQDCPPTFTHMYTHSHFKNSNN